MKEVWPPDKAVWRGMAWSHVGSAPNQFVISEKQADAHTSSLFVRTPEMQKYGPCFQRRCLSFSALLCKLCFFLVSQSWDYWGWFDLVKCFKKYPRQVLKQSSAFRYWKGFGRSRSVGVRRAGVRTTFSCELWQRGVQNWICFFFFFLISGMKFCLWSTKWVWKNYSKQLITTF